MRQNGWHSKKVLTFREYAPNWTPPARLAIPSPAAFFSTACALLKELHFLEDTLGKSCMLHYLRDKEGREIDFLVVLDGRRALMIEVKWADDSLSRNFAVFSKYLPDTPSVQLVGKLDREKSFESGVRIVKAAPWLAELDLETMKPPYDSV